VQQEKVVEKRRRKSRKGIWNESVWSEA